MRPLTKVLACTAALAATGLPASAAPHAGTHAAISRTVAVGSSTSYDPIRVAVRREMTSARAGTAGGGVDSSRWVACVDVRAGTVWMYDCAEIAPPDIVEPTETTPGRLRFRLVDDFWGDVATVNLTLGPTEPAPSVTYAPNGTVGATSADAAPRVSSAQAFRATGTIAITRKRWKRSATVQVRSRPGRLETSVSSGAAAGI